jgi:hypothetical protein
LLLTAALLELTLGALVASEQRSASVQRYWTEHSMLAALTASVITLAVTVLIFDAVIRAREARR